jgi:hypothetical protein
MDFLTYLSEVWRAYLRGEEYQKVLLIMGVGLIFDLTRLILKFLASKIVGGLKWKPE